MDVNATDPVETVLRALETRDVVAAASTFAEDSHVVDPGFPSRHTGDGNRPRMPGGSKASER